MPACLITFFKVTKMPPSYPQAPIQVSYFPTQCSTTQHNIMQIQSSLLYTMSCNLFNATAGIGNQSKKHPFVDLFVEGVGAGFTNTSTGKPRIFSYLT